MNVFDRPLVLNRECASLWPERHASIYGVKSSSTGETIPNTMRRPLYIAVILLILSGVLYSDQIKPNHLIGRWSLIYRGNYGYRFRFYKNYRALCILYLRINALVFKGIYTIEDNNMIRINIYEMKNEENISRINLKRNFTKTASSYFIFQGTIKESRKEKKLLLKPVRIVIDGRNSDGYFEPAFQLNKK